MGLERGTKNESIFPGKNKHYFTQVLLGYFAIATALCAYRAIYALVTIKPTEAIGEALGFVFNLIILFVGLNLKHLRLYWRIFNRRLLRRKMPAIKRKILDTKILSDRMSEESKAKMADQIAFQEMQLAKEDAKKIAAEKAIGKAKDKIPDNDLEYLLRRLRFDVAEETNIAAGTKQEFKLYMGTATGTLAERNHSVSIKKGTRIFLGERDVAMNILAYGGIGSGKTSAVIRPVLKQFLEYTHPRMGGLIFDIKGDFVDEAILLSKRAGRKIQVIGIGKGKLGVNLLAGLSPEMASTFMKSVFYLTGGKTNETYWIDTATILAKNVFGILSYTPEKYNLTSLYEYCFDEEKRAEYEENARAAMIVKECAATTDEERAQVERERRILETYLGFWPNNFSKLEPKLQTGVTSSLTQILENFTHPDLIDTFCSSTAESAELEDIVNKGTIFAIDLPLARWGLSGSAILTFIKLRYFNMIQQRPTRKHDQPGLPAMNQERLCFFLCDEYQNLMSVATGGISDLTFWDKARSAKNIGVVSAQSISSFKSIGDPALIDTVLQNFRGAQVCLRSEDKATQEYFSFMSGRALVQRKSETQGDSESNATNSSAISKGASSSESVSVQEQNVVDVQVMKNMPQNTALGFFNINGEAWDDVIKLEPIFFD